MKFGSKQQRTHPQSPASPRKTPSLKLQNFGEDTNSALQKHFASMYDYYRDKSAVVIDLGEGHVKCGFGGEPGPVAIFHDEELAACFASDFGNRKARRAQWEKALRRLLRMLLFDTLKVKPKQREVLICTRASPPEDLIRVTKATLVDLLGCPRCDFIQTTASVIYTTGNTTGMVVDVGVAETRISAVIEGREVLRAFTTCRQGLADVLAQMQATDAAPAEFNFVRAFEDLSNATSQLQTEAMQNTLFTELPHVSADDSLAEAIVKCLRRLSPENRVLVVQNVILSGSLPFAPFQDLLKEQVLKRLSDSTCALPPSSTKSIQEKFRIALPNFPTNVVPWCGASIAATIAQQSRRRSTR